MNVDADITVVLLVALTIATLMGAASARAHRAYIDWRKALASIPVLRSTAIREALRAAVAIAVALFLLYAVTR